MTLQELIHFYDDRYSKKITGAIERVSSFHNADNKSFYEDLLSWGVVRAGQQVLDVGSGWAIHGDLMTQKNHAKVVKMDLSLVALEFLVQDVTPSQRKSISHVNATAERLPFGSDVFDLVFCSQVLEHVPDHKRTLDEFHRVMKPGGSLVLAVPNCMKHMEKLFHSLQKQFDKSGHLREYGMEEITNLLTSAGFTVSKRRYHCFFVFWFITLIERMWLGRLLRRILSKSEFLEKLVENIATWSLVFENRLLGPRFATGMSIEFVATKS